MTSLIKVLTSVTDIKASEQQSHVVVSGPLQITDTVNTAQSYQLSPSPPISALWTINPPSNQTIINRNIMVRSYLQFDFTGALPQIGTNDSLAAFPFSSLVDVATLTINGESTSENVSDKLAAFLCYGNTSDDRKKKMSLSTAQPDSYQEYSDWTLYGSAKNPLAFWGENSSEPTRGGWEYLQTGPFQFQVTVTEPLFLSPLLQNIGSPEEGMINVNQLNVNLRFKSDTSRAWSHASSGNAINGVTTTFFRAPELLIQYQTPSMLERLPLVQSLPYTKSNEYVKTVPVLAPSASTTIISDSIRLSQIPRCIYLFCRQSDGTTNFTTPQSFLAINNISINWGNQSSLFSQSTVQDLYSMSVENGLNVDFPSFTKYRGSVICIMLGKDLGLLDSEAPGCQGSYTIQVQMNVTNKSSVAFNSQFYMCVLNEGVFSIAQNSARASLGNLTPQLVIQAKDQEAISYNDYITMRGGSFWTSLKSIVGKVARGVSQIAGPLASALPEFAPIISGVGSVAGPLASALGAGRTVGGARKNLHNRRLR